MLRTSLALLIIARSLEMPADSFRNLDFESARVITFEIPGGEGARAGLVSDLLPAWSLYAGQTFGQRTELPTIPYNLPYLEFTGPPYLTLIGPAEQPSGGGAPGQSLFYVKAIPDLTANKPSNSYWLPQRGDVPTDARSVVANGGGFRLWVDGVLANEDGHLFDISDSAGKNVELTFELFTLPRFGPFGERPFSIIDDIHFSTQTIPEPSTVTLIVGAALIALLWRVRKRWH